jgi:large subunit ribosomal protein L1
MDDLAERMQAGDLDFGRVIATPDAMRVVGKLGQLLGPRGLMPNPKDGSVTADVANAVKNAKAGQVKFRNDKAGIIHATIGKAAFGADQLADNLNALIADLLKAKPSTAKGQFLQKVALSSTMGVGVAVDTSSLNLAAK